MIDPTGASADAGAHDESFTASAAPGAQTPAAVEDQAAGNGSTRAAGAGQIGPLPLPTPIPFPLPRRGVSGRYRSSAGSFRLELRIDVDGARTLRRISGDFFSVSGSTTSYFGSFTVDAPAITTTNALVTIDGIGRYTWSPGFPKIRVTVPRVTILQPQAPAALQFFSLSGAPGTSYLCPFESVFFRTVQIETDIVSDAGMPFAAYNTGSLPSGGPARTLSVQSAYAEAGVEMRVAGASDVVQVAEAQAGATWSDAELHASMVRHFSLWQDVPQFKVWQLVAKNYDNPSVLGIMFDQQGKQRQGCAVFNGGLGGTTADKLRLQLYAYVHELGHCFNLLHSWQKSLATPPSPNRPSSLSWMNYPQLYPGGSAAFWAAFAFQFDDQEVAHIRHGFLNNVIMGGSNFAVGSALEDTRKFDRPIEDRSGLRLELAAARSFALGEPIVVDLTLHATDTRGKTVHPHLNPSAGLVQIAISKPNGQVVSYEPMIEQCIMPQTVSINPASPIGESVYIGYGHDGLLFEQPGTYQLRAVYTSLRGSQVVSNIIKMRVRSPVNAADDEIADLLLNDDVGALFYLHGSDADELRSGRDALDKVIDKFGAHPLAAYARLTKGANLAREFKMVAVDSNKVQVRKAKPAESDKLLAGLVDTVGDAHTTDPTMLTAAMLTLAEPARKPAQKAAAAARRAASANASKAMARSYE